jgi:hypothetical protein
VTADETPEDWQLSITMPPVTEHVVVVVVRCGGTVVKVEPGAALDTWCAYERNSAKPPDRTSIEEAIADAHRLAVDEERRRLLHNAIASAVEWERQQTSGQEQPVVDRA